MIYVDQGKTLFFKTNYYKNFYCIFDGNQTLGEKLKKLNKNQTITIKGKLKIDTLSSSSWTLDECEILEN